MVEQSIPNMVLLPQRETMSTPCSSSSTERLETPDTTSSPSPAPSAPQSVLQRKIAPLPVRPKSSDNPSRTLRSPVHSRSRSIEPSLSSEKASDGNSDGPSNHESVNDGRSPNGLSPFAPYVSSSGSVPSIDTQRDTIFTFRTLHNITPRPSPEPEPTLSRPHSSSTMQFVLSPPLSSGPHPATQDSTQSSSSPYSDEKIVVIAADDEPESADPLYIGLSTGLSTRSASRSTVAQPLRSATQQPFELDSLPILPSIEVAEMPSHHERIDSPVPYDVRNEVPPTKAFFYPDFQNALKEGLGISKDTVAAIDKVTVSAGADPNLERLRTDAEELSTFLGTDTRTIAVLGPSGEGMSDQS